MITNPMLFISAMVLGCAAPSIAAMQETETRHESGRSGTVRDLPDQIESGSDTLVPRDSFDEDRQEETADAQAPLPLTEMSDIHKPILEIPTDIVDREENQPRDRSNELFRDNYWSNYPGSFQERLASWDAPDIRYQPLWFEHVSMERYGYTPRPILQPFSSALYFGTSLAFLPFNLVQNPPWECETPLGYCRPGSPAPRVQPRWLRNAVTR